MELAIAQLRVNLEGAEMGIPAHEAEGNAEQAAISRAHAESYRAAIAVLEAQ